MKIKRVLLVLTVVLAIVITAGLAAAASDKVTYTGKFVDNNNKPLVSFKIFINGDYAATTDSKGQFGFSVVKDAVANGAEFAFQPPGTQMIISLNPLQPPSSDTVDLGVIVPPGPGQ